jgi:hypothetical protein
MRSTALRFVPVALALCGFIPALGQSSSAPTIRRFQVKQPPRIDHGSATAASAASTSGSNPIQLPVWNYHVLSTRDGNPYSGLIVGRAPSTTGSRASVSVTSHVVPIKFEFESVATSVDLNTGIITTASGKAESTPTVPDPGCLAGSDNVPLRLFAQSPLFNKADFNFGGTDVGTTQATDAFQRANFWSEIDRNNYHVLLGPVQILPALVVHVPADQGLSLPANIFEPSFSMCSPEGLVSIFFVDTVVVDALKNLPGVTPGTFPMFVMYNTAMPIGDPTNLANCCAGGYHSLAVAATGLQTYSPIDFDVSGFFVPSANDTAIASHEVAEWMDDPYLINATPAWGNTGQVVGCQGNLEVGDPLTGSVAPRIAMSNGFTYTLQELVFFDWFFKSPSGGVHGWFSDNASFLTDAGPPCQ